jgi:hypothetical protein
MNPGSVAIVRSGRSNTMTRFAWLAAVGLVLAGVLLAGAAAQVAQFPKGTFSASIRGEKVTLAFDGKDKFTVKRQDEVLVEGTYKAAKEQIEFTDVKGPIASPAAKPGKYQWKLEGKKLTFTKVEDESEGRAKSLTAEAWVMEG